MTAAFAGTPTLARLAMRLDRVRLPAWILILAIMPAVTAAQYRKLYPTDESISQVSGVISNPSLVALNGPLFGHSLGGLTAWKIMVTELVLIALMSLLTVVRHTRTEEESGRLELIGAAVVGRYAPLSAAVAVAGLADLAVGTLVTLGLLGAGLPPAGSLALGVTTALGGLLFTAVAALACQLTASSRTATALAAGVVGVSFLLRATGDAGDTALTWASPLSWLMRARPYAHERWWLLVPAVALTIGALTGAYAINRNRDLGFGLLPQRPGPPEAATTLRSASALAVRLQRGVLLGWVVGMALWGVALGGAADGVGKAFNASRQLTELLARIGGQKGLVDAYLAAVLGITTMVVAVYAVQATVRMRAEESAGRVEPLLATRTTRIRWALGHLVFPLAASALLLAVAGAGTGLAYGARTHDIAGQLPRLVGAALAGLPAVWAVAGLAVALFGLAPRLTALAWAALIGWLLLQEVGVLLNLSHWIMDCSPFFHLAKLPGGPVTLTPLMWLTGLAATLLAAGLAGFRRRDIG